MARATYATTWRSRSRTATFSDPASTWISRCTSTPLAARSRRRNYTRSSTTIPCWMGWPWNWPTSPTLCWPQSRRRPVPRRRSLGAARSCYSMRQVFNQLVNQLTNQSINQSINQSTNQSINQSINQSTNQSINLSIDQWFCFSTSKGYVPHCKILEQFGMTSST